MSPMNRPLVAGAVLLFVATSGCESLRPASSEEPTASPSETPAIEAASDDVSEAPAPELTVRTEPEAPLFVDDGERRGVALESLLPLEPGPWSAEEVERMLGSRTYGELQELIGAPDPQVFERLLGGRTHAEWQRALSDADPQDMERHGSEPPPFYVTPGELYIGAEREAGRSRVRPGDDGRVRVEVRR